MIENYRLYGSTKAEKPADSTGSTHTQKSSEYWKISFHLTYNLGGLIIPAKNWYTDVFKNLVN